MSDERKFSTDTVLVLLIVSWLLVGALTFAVAKDIERSVVNDSCAKYGKYNNGTYVMTCEKVNK